MSLTNVSNLLFQSQTHAQKEICRRFIFKSYNSFFRAGMARAQHSIGGASIFQVSNELTRYQYQLHNHSHGIFTLMVAAAFHQIVKRKDYRH